MRETHMATFDDFWAAYPKRKGGSPRMLSEKKFNTAIKKGADVEWMISSAKRYGDELREMRKEGTEFVCMASTWINQQRWLDYAPDPENKEREAKDDNFMLTKGYKWNGERWEKLDAATH